MSDSRLRKMVLPRVSAWLYFFVPPTVFGLGLLYVCLIAGSSGYAFDTYQKFEESKKQNLPLQLEAMSDKEKVLPGETFWLHLVAFLDEDWHMYSIEKQSEDETVATRIELNAPAFLPEGDWQETPPKLVRDDVMEKVMKTHSGRAEFTRLFSVPGGLKPGAYPLSGTLHFRSCDNRICTLPQAVKFQTRVIVETGEPG